jgi:Glucodextranase, domain B
VPLSRATAGGALGLFATAVLLTAFAGCGSSEGGDGQVTVRVVAPEDGATVHARRVTVRGTVHPATATVEILGQPAQSAGGVFTASVRLHGGDNRIDVVATDSGSQPATTAITVTRPKTASRRAAANAGGSPSSGAGSGSTAASTGERSCGDGITVNSVTSCPFGIRVRDAYTQQGGPEIEVYSPVTQKTYTMRCASGPGARVTCRGGNNAVVSF